MRLGVALGGGAARGLAHIPVLEALDELGVKPVGLSGTSIGAMMAAGYAAGMSAAPLREHAYALFSDKARAVLRFAATRQGNVWRHGFANGTSFDPIKLMRVGMSPIPETFAGLKVPVNVVATDYYTSEQVVMGSGTLIDAIAASAAIPGLIRPVLREGRVLVDGCLVDPLPFTQVPGDPDVILACDVTGAPTGHPPELPSPIQAILASSQIMISTIIAGQLRDVRPDIVVRPNISRFRALDFLKAPEILEATAPAKEEVKRALDVLLTRA
ncbi:MAG: patatin-like phospholipase family protein [Pseudomonadota bacterium]